MNHRILAAKPSTPKPRPKTPFRRVGVKERARMERIRAAVQAHAAQIGELE